MKTLIFIDDERNFEDVTWVDYLHFDKVVTLSVKLKDGTTNSSTLGINDGYKGTLYDLLNVSFDVTGTVSQYGTFITSIEDLHPANGAYISFAKNGESSMVGVDEAIIEDGDVFSFELVWWDTTEETVSNGID